MKRININLTEELVELVEQEISSRKERFKEDSSLSSLVRELLSNYFKHNQDSIKMRLQILDEKIQGLKDECKVLIELREELKNKMTETPLEEFVDEEIEDMKMLRKYTKQMLENEEDPYGWLTSPDNMVVLKRYNYTVEKFISEMRKQVKEK